MECNYMSVDGVASKKNFDYLNTLEGDKGIGALKTVILGYQNNLRQGSAHVKTRGEVSGTGKKPWRQKGTGMSRQGSKRSPIWPGGGVVFGPRHRDYSQKLNRKVRLLALHRALINRIAENAVIVVGALSCDNHKTTAAVKYVNNFSSTASAFLFIDSLFQDNFILATRNIPYVCLVEAMSLTAWDLLRFEKIVITEAALNILASRLNCKN